MSTLVVSTLDPMNTSTYQLFANLERKISTSGDDSKADYRIQSASVLVQRYNAVLLHDCASP